MNGKTDMARLRAYVINLDRSPDRLRAMAEQLDALGIPWVRVPAVDGRSLGELPWDGYDQRGYETFWGKKSHPGEVGCYLSHVKAFRAFLLEKHDFGLMLEDDCVLSPDLQGVLSEICDLSDQWDVVKLFGNHSGFPATVAQLRNGRRLVSFLQRQTGSVAYVFNRKAAAVYSEKLLPMKVPYDHTFDQVWRFGLRLRGVLPLPVTLATSTSTIGYGGALGRKKPWYRRGAVLGYRAYTETRRVLHYLFSDTVWMSHFLRRSARGVA